MSSTLDEQINQLKGTIAEMEAQRAVLGDDFVDSTLNTLREKLTNLEAKAELSSLETRAIPTRQRKLVTLLYMDVVGSTAMTQHLDPEDNLEIMESALLRLVEPVQEHGGRITRYTGDGFKAVFGDPVSREADPEQAILAGLEILNVSKVVAQEIEREWNIEDFQVRIGIDTGLAALGGQTEAEDTIKGQVVNLAKRIESAAPSGGLLISHNTYRHVRGVFNVEPQEPILAKGFPEPVPVYLVMNLKPRAFRVQTRGVEGIETQMVGRNDELIFLQDALMTAFEEGEGHIVTVSGEAGVGKSRLLYEFQNWLDLLPSSQAVRFFQGRGRQEAQGSPYSLLRDVFTFRFEILDDDTGEQARQKIERGLGEVFGNDEEATLRTHILGHLLGFDFSSSPHLKGVLNDAEQLRNRGVMYLIQYFQHLSQEMPVVIFLEDIHWGDNSSLDVVNRIGEITPQYPILLVSAARPTLFERRPYWGEGQEYHKHLELHPLSKRESRQLVTEILKLAQHLPSELQELVVSGAEGNPFYLEELIKMLIEDGVVIPDEETWQIDMTRLEEIDVPSTLSGVLQARLDSLPPQERTVLQQASVVGRLFWDRIVTYIQAEGGNGDDPELIPLALTSLRNRELVYRHEESTFVGAIEYLFKHDVLREVTYESVIKHLRITYHGLVADWLISNSGDRLEEYSGLIAEHLLTAGREAQAGEYFYHAGKSALASYANFEAEGYYRKALELPSPKQLQGDILFGLGETLYRQGKLDEATHVWRSAIDLYQELGDSNQLANTFTRLSNLLWHSNQAEAWQVCQEGLEQLDGSPDSLGHARLLAESGRLALHRNEIDKIMPLCHKALKMAEKLDDLEVEVEANITISVTIAIDQGDTSKAASILESVIELAEASGYLNAAARAHISYSTRVYYYDVKSSILHILRAAEIYKQIGDVENLIFVLKFSARTLIEHGELNTVEDKLATILEKSTVPKHREDEIWEHVQELLMMTTGEWESALDATRNHVKPYRETKNFDGIHHANILLAWIIMEMNWFGKHDELSEAENVLLENLEIFPQSYPSELSLAAVYARQGRISDARELMIRSLEKSYEIEDNSADKYFLSNLEFEIAYAEEQWSEAFTACNTTSEIFRKPGQRWNWARKLIDLGDVLVMRNEPGDIVKARETYKQSLNMFTEMGAPGYIKVLEERLGNM